MGDLVSDFEITSTPNLTPNDLNNLPIGGSPVTVDADNLEIFIPVTNTETDYGILTDIMVNDGNDNIESVVVVYQPFASPSSATSLPAPELVTEQPGNNINFPLDTKVTSITITLIRSDSSSPMVFDISIKICLESLGIYFPKHFPIHSL